MPRWEWSPESRAKLATVHPSIRMVMHRALELSPIDMIVLEGHRGKEAQDRAVAEGKSKTPWPSSKHNADPSLAVDVAPFPLDWNNKAAFGIVAGTVLAAARLLGVKLRWGGTFGSDKPGEGWDLPHFELVQGDD